MERPLMGLLWVLGNIIWKFILHLKSGIRLFIVTVSYIHISMWCFLSIQHFNLINFLTFSIFALFGQIQSYALYNLVNYSLVLFDSMELPGVLLDLYCVFIVYYIWQMRAKAAFQFKRREFLKQFLCEFVKQHESNKVMWRYIKLIVKSFYGGNLSM